MIQKRYERYTQEGRVWTEWMNYCEDDSQLSRFLKEDKWQLKPILRNEFRIV